MSNRSTVVVALDDEHRLRYTIEYVVYVIEGCVLMSANIPIVIAIIYHSLLRHKKEYIILLAMAFTDAISGFFAIYSAIYRLILINRVDYLTNYYHDCIMTIWSIGASYALPGAMLMRLIVALDRLYMVRYPIRYHNTSTGYAWKLTAVVYTILMIHTIVVYLLAIDADDRPYATMWCYTLGGYHILWYKRYFIMLCLFASMATCITYVVVFVAIRSYLRQSSIYRNNSNTTMDTMIIQDGHRSATVMPIPHRQIDMTISLGILTTFTFILCVLPLTLQLAISWLYPTAQFEHDIESITWILCSFNGVLNIFILSFRHPDLKNAIKMLIIQRKLTSTSTRAAQQQLIDSFLLRSPMVSTRTTSPNFARHNERSPIMESTFAHNMLSWPSRTPSPNLDEYRLKSSPFTPSRSPSPHSSHLQI